MAQPLGTPIPQKEPLYRSVHGKQDQIKNVAGGYVFCIDDMRRALRFVIMGNESAQYYWKPSEIERQNIGCIDRLIGDGRGVELVQMIKDVSVNRRNIKQDPLLRALAICARCNDKDTKKAAYALLSEICRIPTHLFMFIKFCEEESAASASPGTGWGRAHKRAVCNWYSNFENNIMNLARLIMKYKQRESWSHRDVIRLTHLHTDKSCLAFILRYLAKDLKEARKFYLAGNAHDDEATKNKLQELSEYIGACEQASVCQTEDELCYLIEKHNLDFQNCNSKLLKSTKVWAKLLKHMKPWAMVRNLGRMSCYGMFSPNSEEEQMVLDNLRAINQVIESPEEGSGEPAECMEVDMEDGSAGNQTGAAVKRRNQIHPFTILLGMLTYKSGSGEKGHLSWTPSPTIIQGLDRAFYQAFDAVVKTGKKFYLAVDVSGSMSQPVLGSNNIYCSTAAACMMLVTKKTEDNCIIRGFSSAMVEIDIRDEDTLDIVEGKVRRLTMGSTDCARPMIDAMESKIRDIDVFVVYTDNETWYGSIHPSEALRQYRAWSDRRDAKLIVCGMCATSFSIADPQDPGMMDITGFDSSAPRIISEFAMGNL